MRFEVFHSMCDALAHNIRRFYSARILYNVTQITVSKAHFPDLDPAVLEFLQECEVANVSPSEMDAYLYVSNGTFLVYATAIFDSFLSDVTKFLIACRPSAVKDAFTSDFNDISAVDSLVALKNRLLSRKVRKISY